MSVRKGTDVIAGMPNDLINSKANTSLDNLTSIGQNISNWSSDVTNCITEIPQDISVTITNGHLIVNAGSKVYFPNGSGTFDVFTLPSSIDSGDVSSITSDYLFFINNSKTGISGAPVAIVYSGTTAPANPSTGTIWYDTTNNSVKRWSGSAWDGGFSLPVVILSAGAVLHQVFNGFGYIGSTVFALPGVKGLIPDGRNTDGTLKNDFYIINSVITQTFSNSYTHSGVECGFNSTGTNVNYYTYNEKENRNYIGTTQTRRGMNCVLNVVNGRITAFTPKQVFHALDYNDSTYIAHQAMPSDKSITLTAGVSGANYLMPADGYLFAVCGGSIRIQLNLGISITTAGTTLGGGCAFVPVKKGDTVMVQYSTTQYLGIIFYYANGAQ